MMNSQTIVSLKDQNVLIHRPDLLYGREITAGLVEAGATVWVCGPKQADLDRIVRETKAAGSILYAAGTEAAARELVHQIRLKKIELNGFVENSAQQIPSGWDLSFDEISTTLEKTQLALMLTVQQVGLYLSKKQTGSIVLITDYGALVGLNPDNYAQNPAQFDQDFSLLNGFVKGSYVNYVRQAAGFLGESAVRINALAFIPLAGSVAQEFAEAFVRHTHLKRLPEPQDITGSVSFLISDVAKFITGVTIPVDGGYTAK